MKARPDASFTINYWNLAHKETLMYGFLGGIVGGAIVGWIVDAFRARPAK